MKHFCLLCLLLCLCCTAAFADTLTLPASLQEIGAQAFRNDLSLDEVVVPEGTLRIGSLAFSGSSVQVITLSDSITEIADDAFDGCASVQVIASPGSYAAQYVDEHDQLWIQDITTYRAFVLCQTYPGSPYELVGPAFDAPAVTAMLRTMDATPYTVTSASNLTASGILNGLSSAFAGADENDVSLFYYVGHGLDGGWLLGTDMQGVTPSVLRNMLDSVPGKKIILVDACYSGALIARGATLAVAANTESTESADKSAANASAFVSQFMSAFKDRARSVGYLDDPPYYVLTACAGNELAWERTTTVTGSSMNYGLFTYSMLLGSGYNEIYSTRCALNADTDSDSLLTLSEVYRYAARSVSSMSTSMAQTVSVYPSGSSQVLYGRLVAEEE